VFPVGNQHQNFKQNVLRGKYLFKCNPINVEAPPAVFRRAFIHYLHRVAFFGAAIPVLALRIFPIAFLPKRKIIGSIPFSQTLSYLREKLNT